MSQFKSFAKAINTQFNTMSKDNLFVVDISKEQLWDAYQISFPEGTNDIYIERPKHDCQCCKQFIRNVGAVVSIVDNQLVSVWDIEIDSFYQDIANTMSKLIKSAAILSPFIRAESKYGLESNIQLLADNSTITWDHFYAKIPSAHLSSQASTDISKIVSTVGVFKRGLEELTLDALNTVQSIIQDKLLYRGEEHQTTVSSFLALRLVYDTSANKDLFIWSNHKSPVARFKNTVIGSLVQDLSEGKNLESAVKSFESKVAPENYKRTSALITQGMIDQATSTISELDLEDSLHRRLAVTEDVSINNVLYADRSTAKHMKGSIGDLLSNSAAKPVKASKTATDITIDDFLANVLPSTISLEMELSNSHQQNLMTLVAPQHQGAKHLFKWNNNFSWSYNGNITDSGMKDKVKAAGGKVDGILRFSIQWNEDKLDAQNDLDAHCQCPQGHIFYSNKMDRLDVDVTQPGINTAVENITWPTLSDMKNGTYRFYVHNFSGRNAKGFRAEIEIDGTIHQFDYPKRVTSDIYVATVTLKDGKFTIDCHLPSSETSKTIWNIQTKQYHKVNMALLSPNFWDEQIIGNKHHFFILDECVNPEPVNGFYNEFLSNELTPHRKTLEILSSKMRCEPSDQALSGLGFSSTQRNEVLIKADKRLYNLKF